MKLTKQHIGTTVWLVPEGNELRSGRGPREGAVLSMTRTRGVMLIDGLNVEFTVIDRRQGADYINTTFNGGYTVHADYAEIERMAEAAPLRSKIERTLYSLPADKILAIADIAGVR